MTTVDFPELLLADTTSRDGLEIIALGEDYNHLVILGHPQPEQALAVLTAQVAADWGHCDPDNKPLADELDYTWARLLTQGQFDARFGDTDSPWCLDWATENGSNEGKPNYFPVIVWSTEG